MLYYSQKAKQYYNTEIKDKCYDEIIKTMAPKDAMIELVDLERNHSLTGSLSDIPSFLDNLHELWVNFMNELYSIVDLIFSGTYEADFIRIDEFDKVVDEEITYYRKKC